MNYYSLRKRKRKEWIVKDINEVCSAGCDQLIRCGKAWGDQLLYQT
jgi:hypothetical protein